MLVSFSQWFRNIYLETAACYGMEWTTTNHHQRHHPDTLIPLKAAPLQPCDGNKAIQR